MARDVFDPSPYRHYRAEVGDATRCGYIAGGFSFARHRAHVTCPICRELPPGATLERGPPKIVHYAEHGAECTACFHSAHDMGGSGLATTDNPDAATCPDCVHNLSLPRRP